ncbi:MAG TPA: hypothetical protein PK869_13190 [Candidatus Hydrogenedentes bacterium]|nr:hypothetical protein [Candidatus Hydrogenedentota bacterium]
MPGFGGSESLVDAMEHGAFGFDQLAGGGEFLTSPVTESSADMDSPDFPISRVDPAGNRSGIHGKKEGSTPEGGGAAGGDDRYTALESRWNEQFTTLQRQAEAREQALMQTLQQISQRMAPASTPQTPAEPESLFSGIEDSMPADEFAALPVETKQALRAIDANNRRNFEAVLAKLPGGESPQLSAALQKVQALEQQFQEAQSAQKFQAVAQQAQAAKAKYDPEGKGVLAPYQHKLAEAIDRFGYDVETAIRVVAPEVYNAAVVREAMKTETRRIQNETLAGLYGLTGVPGGPGAPNGNPHMDVGFKTGESVGESRAKILAKLGLGNGNGNGRLF